MSSSSDSGEESGDERPRRYMPQSRSTAAKVEATSHHHNSPLAERLNEVLDNFMDNYEEASYNSVGDVRAAAEIIEEAMDEFLKKDPDPLDDRHPSKTHPSSSFGFLLKTITRNDIFLNKINDYILTPSNLELNVTAARLLLDLVPGLDPNGVFTEAEELIGTLYNWALSDSTTVEQQAYAVGILACALDARDVASNFRPQNQSLISVALRRLKKLKEEQAAEKEEKAEEDAGGGSGVQSGASSPGPFAGVDIHEDTLKMDAGENSNSRDAALPTTSSLAGVEGGEAERMAQSRSEIGGTALRIRKFESGADVSSELPSSPTPKRRRKSKPPVRARGSSSSQEQPPLPSLMDTGTASNSQWTLMEPIIIGHHKIHPLSRVMHQRLILQYLAPTGEYQDLLPLAFEHHSMDLLLDYVDLSKANDIRLTFDALKYLASLLVHRRFALEWISRGGIEALLKVPRASMASVGVATCLYYLAYSEDTMERLCLLPDGTVNEMVDYALWLLEHSYESGMASAAMFFSHAFAYRAILERFDLKDGLRKLHNYVSTLTIFADNSDDLDVRLAQLTEEQFQTSVQSVRNGSLALRGYAMAHLYLKCADVRRKAAALGITNGVPHAFNPNLSHAKAMSMDLPSVRGGIQILDSLFTLQWPSVTWRLAEEFRRLGIVRSLLSVLKLYDSRDFGRQIAQRMDTMKAVLETLWVVSASTSVRLDLCESISLGRQKFPALSIVLDLCSPREEEPDLGESDRFDTMVILMAIEVIINCVCAPIEGHVSEKESKESSSSTTLTPTPRKTKRRTSPLAILDKLWKAVRACNGIMILNNLLLMKPNAAAGTDSCRAAACRALSGMARCEEVRQIVSRMPLITANELQMVIREPVLEDRRAEHAVLQKETKTLLEIVTQKPIHDKPNDLSHERLWRSHVVANTRIQFNDTELLQLIAEHLRGRGFEKSAEALEQEANLPLAPASSLPITAARLDPFPSAGHGYTTETSLMPRRQGVDGIYVSGLDLRIGKPVTQEFLKLARGDVTATSRQSISDTSVVSSSSTSLTNGDFRTPQPPSKSVSRRNKSTSEHPSEKKSSTARTRHPSEASPFPRRLTLKSVPSTPLAPKETKTEPLAKPYTDLSGIVTEFFRVQHSQCARPVTTCPPFSLFFPHKCPEPEQRDVISTNVTSRLLRRPMMSMVDRLACERRNERFVFSRLKPSKTFTDPDEVYTACAFSIDDEHLIVGTYTGDVHWLNVETQNNESSTSCHHSMITSIEQSKDGAFLLTSSAYVAPLSALWKLGERQEHMFDLHAEHFVAFSNLSSERIVGTNGEVATIYDTDTGRPVVKLYEEGASSRYKRNRASFSPDDKLVHSDGILWDVRVGNDKPVHKFDKLNAISAGVFHPHGTKIIINTEEWDIRSFRLLNTVPLFAQCKLSFTSSGNVLYATQFRPYHLDEYEFRETLGPIFRSFDSTDFSVLATVDLRRPLLDLAADHSDTRLATIEIANSGGGFSSGPDTLARLVEIGLTRDEDDDDNDEDDQDVDAVANEEEEESESDEDMSDESEDDNEEDEDDDDDDDDEDGGSAEASESENEESASEDGGVAMADNNQDGEEAEEQGEQGEAMDEEEDEDGVMDIVEILQESGVQNPEVLARRLRRIQRRQEEEEEDEDEEEEEEEGGEEEAESDEDETFQLGDDEEDEDAHPGTSSIVLNPNLRKRRRDERR